MTLRPGTKPRLGKGQPEGIVVTGRTGKLRVAEESLVFNDAAGQNNSNLASLLTSVINDGWELILAMSSHYCFYTPSSSDLETHADSNYVSGHCEELATKQSLSCITNLLGFFVISGDCFALLAMTVICQIFLTTLLLIEYL
jgi:hypothetical protein